jgi:HEAT repeat protein
MNAGLRLVMGAAIVLALGSAGIAAEKPAAPVVPTAGAVTPSADAAPAMTPEMARLIERLGWGSAHPDEAAEARRGLVQIGQPAVAPLVWTMMDRGPVKDAVKSAAAAGVLVEMAKAGQAEAFGALITGLKAPGSAGWQCANALGEIGNRRAVEPLLNSLDVWGQTAVIEALGKLGDPRAVEPILAKLSDKSPGTRGAAARALARLGDRRAVEPIIDMLGDKDADVRRVAIDALGVLKDRRATAPLLALIQDKGFGVPPRAISALGKIGDPAAVQPLIALLEDKELSEPAATALGKIGDRRAVEPLIMVMEKTLAETKKPLGKGMPAIIWSGGEALGLLGDKRAVPLMLDLIQRPQGEGGEFTFAAEALGRIADPDSLAKLAALLRDDKQPWSTRQEATWALAWFRTQEAFDLLVSALDDPGTRAWALRSLGQKGDPRAIPPVEKVLTDKDSNMREIAVEVLKTLKAKAAPSAPAAPAMPGKP